MFLSKIVKKCFSDQHQATLRDHEKKQRRTFLFHFLFGIITYLIGRVEKNSDSLRAKTFCQNLPQVKNKSKGAVDDFLFCLKGQFHIQKQQENIFYSHCVESKNTIYA